MVSLNKLFKRRYELSISSSRTNSARKKVHILEENSMTSVELFSNHLNIGCIRIYHNSAYKAVYINITVIT